MSQKKLEIPELTLKKNTTLQPLISLKAGYALLFLIPTFVGHLFHLSDITTSITALFLLVISSGLLVYWYMHAPKRYSPIQKLISLTFFTGLVCLVVFTIELLFTPDVSVLWDSNAPALIALMPFIMALCFLVALSFHHLMTVGIYDTYFKYKDIVIDWVNTHLRVRTMQRFAVINVALLSIPVIMNLVLLELEKISLPSAFLFSIINFVIYWFAFSAYIALWSTNKHLTSYSYAKVFGVLTWIIVRILYNSAYILTGQTQLICDEQFKCTYEPSTWSIDKFIYPIEYLILLSLVLRKKRIPGGIEKTELFQ
jgi:hypothetical protein